MTVQWESRSGEQYEIFLDKVDTAIWKAYGWYVAVSHNGHVTVRRDSLRKHYVLAHAILGTPQKGYVVDHINGDPLDNRRANLRFASIAQNCANRISKAHTSGYKGVSWKRKNEKWVAQIKHRGKVIHLGLFNTEVAAAIAYNVAAQRLFGAYAKINVIKEL